MLAAGSTFAASTCCQLDDRMSFLYMYEMQLACVCVQEGLYSPPKVICRLADEVVGINVAQLLQGCTKHTNTADSPQAQFADAHAAAGM